MAKRGREMELDVQEIQEPGAEAAEYSTAGNDWWLWETLSLAICGLTIVAIAVIVHRLDGQPQPDWSFRLGGNRSEKKVSVNSVLSWLSTIARLGLTFALANSLGQLKWVRFARSKKLLTEFGVFDESTRGFLGSAKLIWILKGRYLASAAALATILSVGFEPFVQNMVSYYPSFANNTDIARIAIATNYTQHYATLGVPDFEPQINENVFGSVFGNNDDINLPSFLCRSGNCVWPVYSTLAICARCLDLTNRITIGCDGEICSATLPNGYGLRNSSFMYTNASGTFSKDNYQNLSTPFPISVIQLVKAENTTVITNSSVIIAAECALVPCVQTFSGSVGSFSGKTFEDLAKDAVNDPNLRESLVKTWDNYTVEGEGNIDFITIAPPPTLDSGITPGQNFTMSRDAFTSLRNGITLRFANGVIKWTNGHHQSTSDLTDAFYKMDNPNCEDHLDGGANNSLICGVQRVAAAMTKAIRQDAWDFNSTNAAADMAPGVTSVPVTRIKISWGWLSLPVLLWLASVLVLIDTAWKTRKTGTPVWKTGALPVLNLKLVPAGSRDAKISSPATFKKGEIQYGHLDINRDSPVMVCEPLIAT